MKRIGRGLDSRSYLGTTMDIQHYYSNQRRPALLSDVYTRQSIENTFVESFVHDTALCREREKGKRWLLE